MIRYILAILLVHTCYYSLGHPTVDPNISGSIFTLARNCKNSLLQKLFNGRLNECNITALQYKTKQLQCLMFYDMGHQLCTALSDSQITINEDYISKINEETDVNNLCDTAKDWVFTDLPAYKMYKNLTETEFKHPATCGKFCGLDDGSINNNANFYCKFYRWGRELIYTPVNTTQNITTVIAITQKVPDTPSIIANKHTDLVKNDKEIMDISIKSTTTNNKPKETEPSSDPSEKAKDTNNVNTNTALILEAKNIPVPHNVDSKTGNPEDTQTNFKIPEEPSVVAPVNVVPDIKKGDKEVQTKNIVSTVPLSDTANIKPNIEPETIEHKETVLENPKDKVVIQSDHYLDDELNSEEGKEANDEIIQSDVDVGDPMTGDKDKTPQQNTQKGSKIEPDDSSFNKEISQKEFFSGNAQDLGADDDDHFFTFFLTAVVLVVLLYILYHDKSKISKLFFGLLVEGRSGRRRNSRGHAYRRLDTLEQAMSTNTAAPPSKIIY